LWHVFSFDVLVVAVAAVLLAAAGGGLALLRPPDERAERTVGGVGSARVRLAAGRVEISEADRDDARIELTARRRRGRPRPTVAVAGGVLEIDDRVGETRVRLRLPRATPVRAEVRRGEVTVWGSAADLVLVTESGTVAARELSGARVHARSGGGDVSLHFAGPPRTVSAASDTGSVTVVVPGGPYAVQTETGDPGAADVDVPDEPGAARSVTARSRAGRVRVAGPVPGGPVRL
jgi:hypothetical protein